jgi:hypothetical protein
MQHSNKSVESSPHHVLKMQMLLHIHSLESVCLIRSTLSSGISLKWARIVTVKDQLLIYLEVDNSQLKVIFWSEGQET